jgi:low-affinity ferrous iron transport protein
LQLSDRWQLYINDATSALMVLVFAFLACLRECYADYTNTCLEAIFRLDSTLEKELRRLSKDDLPNQMEVILPPKETFLQVVIFYYADIIGTLVGIIFLVIVMIAWSAVGPVFHFNSNWWLLIGTYAGLVGLFDSFVLRTARLLLWRRETWGSSLDCPWLSLQLAAPSARH